MPRNWAYRGKRYSGYRSKLEETVAKALTEKGIKFGYETLVFEYKKKIPRGKCDACGGTKVSAVRRYTPDFVLENGFIIEVKGRLTATDRTKLLSVRESNHGIRLVLLFGSDNKIRKNSEKRYSDWATEHGFDFGILTIPRRWLSRRQSKDSDRKQEITS